MMRGFSDWLAHSPEANIEGFYAGLKETKPVWISIVARDAALARARQVAQDGADLPLRGLPFAVKDNIDVAGMETTAACPEFAFVAKETAPVVQKLEAAGAILVGKTNMDQFATGLVGVRSPYGVCHSVYSEQYVSGGSSSGSAVAVAQGAVAFSLGTDTAGSGRVPAAFNNLVGLKPTRGLLSTSGVLPACQTLDCVSVFTTECADAARVLTVAEAAGSRQAAAPWLGSGFRFGVPPENQLEFFGDDEARALFAEARERLTALGGVCVEMDYTPFRQAAELLYAGPWVAERWAAIGDFASAQPAAVHPVVLQIIRNAEKYSATDAFKAQYRLQELISEAAATWRTADILLLPTTPTIYRISEVLADPIRLNSQLGYYTNFVNLMDLSALAVPAGFRSNGLPFGVSLIGQAYQDHALLALGQRWQTGAAWPATPPGCGLIAVVGAHLTGQPLNGQLTARGARLIRTARTAAGYRFYALEGTTPLKPGLVREPGFEGPGIELEIWALPRTEWGGFVNLIPAPLGIGSIELEDGSNVQGFLCEPYALRGARDITGFAGWRAYLAAS